VPTADDQLHCLILQPDFSAAAARRTLAGLLVPGPLRDQGLAARCRRLAERFRVYRERYPLPWWAPGLVTTREMASLTECYLPLAEIRAAFAHLYRRSLAFPAFLPATPFWQRSAWLDVLPLLPSHLATVDPASLLLRLLDDGALRQQALFAFSLPRRYGGDFARYPGQQRFLRHWLAESRDRLRGVCACLDAACGAGEGTYGLVTALAVSGYRLPCCRVVGTTVDPLELVAAAHGRFPHDPDREREFRAAVAPILEVRGELAMEFRGEDICRGAGVGGAYDLVICNGLLGGPLLHEPAALASAVAGLVARMRPGGLFLAADRFHAGWKRQVTTTGLGQLLKELGVRPVPLEEGVGGIRN
jgi:hypothetical protein